jgi:ABC-type polysaccharide/polyol phosphate transport system ATPase subunit
VSDIALRVDHVYKRFRKGEMHDSLRDLIPALTGRVFSTSPESDSRAFWALQDVSFDVFQGEAFGIIGHNGAGKSTMLKILSRIIQPTRGSMSVRGRLSALIEIAAGFHKDLTGRENIFLNGTIIGMSRKEIEAKLEAIVEFSGLSEFIDTPVKRYSSGMYARLGFAVSAHVDPEVMIVDEVLSVGDFVFQQKCVARMMEIIKSGATVLFVSHNLRVLTELCDRCLLLDHGKPKAIGPTSEVIGAYLEGERKARANALEKPVYISEVRILGSRTHFNTGETVRIQVEVVANENLDNVAVVLCLLDEHYYEVLNTSTERLGRAPYKFESGRVLRCTFELTLNLGFGTYHIGVSLHRYNVNKPVDGWTPAETFYVGSSLAGYRGIVPAEPKVAAEEWGRTAAPAHRALETARAG